jgi:hypothetical protein
MHHTDASARSLRDPRFFQFVKHHCGAHHGDLADLLVAIFREGCR